MLTKRRHIDTGPVPTVESTKTYEALWWLPEDSGDKVPGKVIIDPENGIHLILNGVFQSHGSRLKSQSFSKEPVILGTQHSGAQFTLLSCEEQKQEVPFGSGFQRQRFVADRILIGHHFERPEDVRLEWFSVNVTHLKDWMRNVGLSHPERTEEGFFIEYDPDRATTVPKLRATLPSASITVRSRPGRLGGNTAEDPMGIEISEWIKVIPNSPISVETALETYIEPLLDFLSLATAAPNSLLRLRAKHPEDSDETPKRFLKIHPTTDYPRFERRSLFNRGQVLFLADDVDGRFQEVMDKWYGVYEEMEDVCDLFFGVHYNQGMPLTNQFLSIMRSLETYHRVRFSKYDIPQNEHGRRVKKIISFIPSDYKHRQWANDILYNSNYMSLKSRMAKLIEEGRPVVNRLVEFTEDFAKWAKDTRNFFTHRDERSSMNVARGERLGLLNQSLLWIMRIHFMREVGLTPSQSEELLEENDRFRVLVEACAEAPWNQNGK